MVKIFPSGSKSLDMTKVQELDGIGTINLNANSKDKSLKTEAGSRLVPIHPLTNGTWISGLCWSNQK